MFERCTSTNGTRTASKASRTARLVWVNAAALITAPSERPFRPWIASTSSPSWLVCTQLHSTPRARGALDLRQAGASVDFRLALTQQIQVGAVQDGDVRGHRRLGLQLLQPL